MENKIKIQENGKGSLSNVKFIPIILDSLAIDSILNFDLYFRNPKEKKYILFRSKNLKLDSNQFNIIKTKFKTLYIPSSEQADYCSEHYFISYKALNK